MTNKKILFLSVLSVLLLLPSGLKAEGSLGVCLHRSNGSKVYFTFEEHPKISFVKTLTVIRSTKTSIASRYDQFHKVDFENLTSIVGTKTTDGKFVTNEPGRVTLTDFEAGLPVSVVSINGVCLYKTKTEAGVPVQISLSEYPKGVYVISAGSTSFKVMN